MIGSIIKEERNKIGISQEQLAEKVGVSRSAVAKWENDLCLPDIDNLIILSELFGKSIDYLVTPMKKEVEDEHTKDTIAEKRKMYSSYVLTMESSLGLLGMLAFASGSSQLNHGTLSGVSDLVFSLFCDIFFVAFLISTNQNLRDKHYPKPSRWFQVLYNIMGHIRFGRK